jgi:hypothetical protein
MTDLKTAKAELNALDLSINTTKFGEYRVAFKHLDREAAELSAYYATDLDDAVSTGRAMHDWRIGKLMSDVASSAKQRMR